MAGMWTRKGELVTTVSEVVGYKSGLALTGEELLTHLPDEDRSLFEGDQYEAVRIRSEVYESIVAHVLYSVGNIESPDATEFNIRLFAKYRHDQKMLQVFSDVLGLWTSWVPGAIEKASADGSNLMDPGPLFEAVEEAHGVEGLQVALEIIKGQEADMHRSPWGSIRRVDWQDAKELRGLFESQNLDTLYGSFLDQRYIDYLAQNSDAIAEMNWRKFEALTCEFFERTGHQVQIGPGRNDDGVDARIWTEGGNTDGPPLIIVQCKREKQDVGKVVVKALWADMQEEEAESGLVVTSSRVSPGGKKVSQARGYNIKFAERDTVVDWVKALRSPRSGLFEPDY